MVLLAFDANAVPHDGMLICLHSKLVKNRNPDKGYNVARQRRAVAVTRQRPHVGRRHHAARQRGALARLRTRTWPASYVGKQRSDVRPRLLATGFG
jgi:hypothetical protein